MRYPRPWMILFAMTACDRPAAPVATTSSTKPPIFAYADFSPVTALAPARPTHITADSQGTIAWVQESPKGDDTVFFFRDGVPRASKLSARAVLDALGAPQAATGNIQSLVADRNDVLLFYFTGGWARTSVGAIGRFDPLTEKLTILASPKSLADASGLQAGIGLARGTIIPTATDLYLHLASPADSLLLRTERSNLDAGKFSRPFNTIDSPDGPLPIRGDAQRFAPAGGDDVLFLDPRSAALWRVDPAGRATLVQSLVAVPEMMSTPVAVGENAEIITLFAADSDALPAANENRADPIPLTGQPPHFVIVAGGTFHSLGRAQLHAPAGTSVYQMQLQQLVPEPGTPNLLGYDATSGLLYRIHFVPRAE